jgi:hypothetical protein
MTRIERGISRFARLADNVRNMPRKTLGSLDAEQESELPQLFHESEALTGRSGSKQCR